jgi:cytochrome P450
MAEAAWAYRRAWELGMGEHARGWALQSFIVGFPATRVLLQISKNNAALYEGAKPIPTIKTTPVVGDVVRFAKAPLHYLIAAQAEKGDIVRFQVGPNNWVLLSEPALIQEVLINQAPIFYKPRVATRLWKPFLGMGLLTAEGDYWRSQSRMIRPGFHRKRIEAYGREMVRLTEEMLASWTEGEDRAIDHEMAEVTLAIVAKTLFDADVKGDARRVGDAMEVINTIIVEHIHMPIPVPKWWPSKKNRRKVSAIKEIRDVVRGIIEERRGSGEDRGDLLSTLVFARDEEGNGMSDQVLFDEAMTLFFAGHETTALQLTWMWYLLATHPDVQEQLHSDIRSVTGGAKLEVSHLRELPLLDAVIKESMRILPSVWIYMREPTRDARVGDYVIPQGHYVAVSQYVLGHDERRFADPEVFDPSRWTREFEKSLPKGAYVPFSAGPRVCAGKAFAMMESALILGTMVQHVVLQIPEDYELELEAVLSLHPKHGMPTTVRFRAEHAAGRQANASR